MKEFIEYLAKHLVDEPEKVVVEESTTDEGTIAFTLKVADKDIGKVIGKKGKNVQAMRTLLNCVGAKGKHRATLEILDKDSKT